MPITPIYTDKDYLDAQFQHIDERFDRHDKRHENDRRANYSKAGLLLTAAGLVSAVIARLT